MFETATEDEMENLIGGQAADCGDNVAECYGYYVGQYVVPALIGMVFPAYHLL